MTADIISLDDKRPHINTYAACMDCGHDWVAVAPVGTKSFHCPKCASERGVVVDPNDEEFFKEFITGGEGDATKNWNRRMTVLLNAKRMIDRGDYTP